LLGRKGLGIHAEGFAKQAFPLFIILLLYIDVRQI